MHFDSQSSLLVPAHGPPEWQFGGIATGRGLRHGFAKSEKYNIEKDELVALKKLAAELLAYDDKALARVVASGVLAEVNCDEETVS